MSVMSSLDNHVIYEWHSCADGHYDALGEGTATVGSGVLKAFCGQRIDRPNGLGQWTWGIEYVENGVVTPLISGVAVTASEAEEFCERFGAYYAEAIRDWLT